MSTRDSKRKKAREVVDILEEISVLLNTPLDRAQLSLCVSLIENGVNPEALAVWDLLSKCKISLTHVQNAIKELRQDIQEQAPDNSVSDG